MAPSKQWVINNIVSNNAIFQFIQFKPYSATTSLYQEGFWALQLSVAPFYFLIMSLFYDQLRQIN